MEQQIILIQNMVSRIDTGTPSRPRPINLSQKTVDVIRTNSQETITGLFDLCVLLISVEDKLKSTTDYIAAIKTAEEWCTVRRMILDYVGC